MGVQTLKTLLILTAVVWVFIPILSSADTLSYHRQALEEQEAFLWPQNGAWVRAGQEFVIVDSYRQAVIEVGSQRALLSSSEASQEGMPVDLRFQEGYQDDQGIQVEDELFVQWAHPIPEGEGVNPDREGRFRDRIYSAELEDDGVRLNSVVWGLQWDALYPLTNPKGESEGQACVWRIFDWQPLAGGRLLALADYGLVSEVCRFADIVEGGEFRRGFIWIDPLQGISELHTIHPQDPDRDQYLRTVPSIATLKDRAFILLLDSGNPRVAEFSTKMGTLKEPFDVPREYQSRPEIPGYSASIRGPEREYLALRQIEESKMVVSLYAWNENLYLLVKEAAELVKEAAKLVEEAAERNPRDTVWRVLQIAPDSGGELQRAIIPTQAPNLRVIPGDDEWVFIERSAVESLKPSGAPYMENRSVLFADMASLFTDGHD